MEEINNMEDEKELKKEIINNNEPIIEGNRISFPLNILPGQIIPSKIKLRAVQPILIPPPLSRKRHIKVNAELELLDIRISKQFFEKEVKKLVQKSEVYKSIWTIKEIYFPNIFLNIYSTDKKILFVLSVNLRNYNYYPPEIGLLTPNMMILQNVDSKFKIPDDKGNFHLKNHDKGAWFCTPGTFTYHDFYFDIDRWELERYNQTCELIEILNRVIEMINRN